MPVSDTHLTSVAASVYGGTTGLLTTCCSDFPKEVLQRIEGLGIDVSEVLAVLGRQRRSFMEYSEQFERVTHSPVSYTQLDVSKRQILTRSGLTSLMNWWQGNIFHGN